MSDSAPDKLWEPSAELVEKARLTEFMRWLEAERGLDFADYDALWRWSVDDLDGFWGAIWDFFEVQADGDRTTVLASRQMPGARWFPDTQPQLRRARLRRQGRRRDGDPARLRAARARRAELGRAARPGRGRRRRRCAGSGSSAATASSPTCRTSPRRSSPSSPRPRSARSGRAARPTSARPASSTASPRSSPRSSSRSTATATAARTSTAARRSPPCRRRCRACERTVVLPYLDPDPDLSALRDATTWDELLAAGAGAELNFERVPFDHPLWVLYSSGTTGLPKAIVQGQGGILLEHLKKLHLHVDAHPGDRLFWFTTTGWMMWNFLVSGLLTEAAIVLYDGSPGHPDMNVLWDLAERAGVTTFGTSASYIAACMKDGRASPAPAATSAASAPSARPAPPSPPRASTGSTSSSAPTPGCSRPAAAPTSAQHSSAAARCCRSTAASCRRGRSAPRSRPGTRRATR